MKPNFFYIFGIFIFFLISCNSQESNQAQNTSIDAPSLDFVKTFEGQINNKYDIAMKLMSNSGQITGNYFYKSVGTAIQLKGQVKEDGNITLNEFDKEGNQTGIFNGKIINSSKIEGQWSKPNGDKQMSFFIIESNSNYETSQKDISASDNLENKIIGDHKFSLQWISWDYFGNAKIYKKNSELFIEGKQQSNTDNDYVTINGKIKLINEREFKLHGKIITMVAMHNNGEPCIKDGVFTFKASGNRKFWRLQEMENCEGGMLVDYVDVFF